MLSFISALSVASVVFFSGDATTQPNYNIEFRVGPYQPDFGDASEQAFFETFFGEKAGFVSVSNESMMLNLEGAYYFMKGDAGLVGLTGGVGWWSKEGKTRKCTDASGINIACTFATIGDSADGNDKTRFATLPLSLGLVYRFDQLKRHLYVPFVFYVKGGLDYVFWWSSSSGERELLNGESASGGTFGYHGALGVAFNLDWLEPSAARKSSSQNDVVDAYIFFEARRSWIDGFGDSTRVDFSDTYGQLGLAIEWL